MARQKGRRKPPNAVERAITNANRRIREFNKRHGANIELIPKETEATLRGGQRAQYIKQLNKINAKSLTPTTNSDGVVGPRIFHNWLRNNIDYSPNQRMMDKMDLAYVASPTAKRTTQWNQNLRARLIHMEREGSLVPGTHKKLPTFTIAEAEKINREDRRTGGLDLYKTTYNIDMSHEPNPEEASEEVIEVITKMLGVIK